LDTKWKNRLGIIAWLLLFAFGLNGILNGLSNADRYLKKDYFQTGEFEAQLNQFIAYLSTFELNDMTKEEAKKKIKVTEEEINEHRYRYGDLPDQIANIKNQYESKIQRALLENNQEIADMYIAERDMKIEDITNNFKSDEHVRAKIVKEKEEKIDAYYQEIESLRPEFNRWKSTFVYYLKDIETKKVYTNLGKTQNMAAGKKIDSQNTLFLRNYPGEKYDYISTGTYYIPTENHDGAHAYESISSIIRTERKFEGTIAIPKSISKTNPIWADYQRYRQEQTIFFVYVICGIIAFLLSLYLYKKNPGLHDFGFEKLQSYYRRIPIDVRVTLLLLLTGLLFISMGWSPYIYYPYRYELIWNLISSMLTHLIYTALFVALIWVQCKFLLEEIKEEMNWKTAWQKSLLYKFYQGLRETFLIRSIGVQVLLLLAAVFAFGAGAIIVIVEPGFILLYAPAFFIIGIPILLLIIMRAGYLNRIVLHTNELVEGNLDSDLPVKGKSAFATLAANINALKYGVKQSLKEQAKSERLKTELITNVSHDLRTPLTSIITYTELLKTPELSAEDRDAYIQIIDRKSKRLKVLIDDLFEASKMASGNVELSREKVDMVQLLQQALAEYDESIRKSTLQFRISTPEKPVFAVVDGQKMWRVFDNLIGNILKYSLENTRVYISIENINGKAIIVFKNIAKYELGKDTDELFERFKRGDTSRHTEGSGLGLAIAKSIVDLHGGDLDIQLDGDLFKVTVSLNT
jgi:signal transduction histidine kinase